MGYKSVGIIANNSDKEITVFLEMLCEEIKVAPNLSFELFIEDDEERPVTFQYHEDSIVIYPNRTLGKWLIIFNGEKIVPSYPTILKDYTE